MSHGSLTFLSERHKAALERVFTTLPEARLSGGTALMIQINHRRSYDLDLLLPESLAVSKIEKDLQKVLGLDLRLIQASSDQMNIEWQDIRISLIYFPFTPLEEPFLIGNLRITDVHDIASEKAYALGRREEWRDYVDLYSIIIGKWADLNAIIRNSEKRFQDAFSTRLFLNQLAAAEEVPLEPIDWIPKPVDAKTICDYFHNLIGQYDIKTP